MPSKKIGYCQRKERWEIQCGMGHECDIHVHVVSRLLASCTVVRTGDMPPNGMLSREDMIMHS
jgi:hypothetical protein